LTDGHRLATRPVTPVAVGVIVRADGAVLLADRPVGKPYAGYWEFPGGKIESGESVEQALERELAEELGVRVRSTEPWTVLEYDYPHAYVRLHFQRIFDWLGTPHPVEGQQLMFLRPGEAPPTPLLPAAAPALRWMQLPTVTAYSEQASTDAQQALQWVERALARGLRQILWYEPLLAGAALEQALRVCGARARAYGARLLIDNRIGARGPELADGCFLSVDQLRTATVRPSAQWVGAGVRDQSDLAHAAALACDFAVVQVEASHQQPAASDAIAAWETISALCRASPLPLYAELEPNVENLRQARRHGAHGLAIRLPS
jgi:8-oxo-dGTP diphosphatase